MRGLPLVIALAASSAVAAPKVTWEPNPVYAGSRDPVRLRVADTGRVRGVASAGSLRDAGVENGQRLFEWTLAPEKVPSTGVLVFVGSDPNDPAVVIVPLLGKTDLEIDTEPSAQVRVVVAGQTYGPRAANARGKVKVPIDVPPGAQEAQVLAETGGTSTRQVIPLQIPNETAISAAFANESVPRGGSAALLFVATSAPLQPDAVRVTSTPPGEIALLRSQPGLLVFRVPTPTTGEVLSARAELKANAKVSATAETRLVDVTPDTEGPSSSSGPVNGFQLVASVSAGPFVGTGSAAGPSIGLRVGPQLSILGGRLALSFEPGLNVLSFGRQDATSGDQLDVAVYAFPLEPFARLRLLSLGPVGLRVFAHAGPVPFSAVISSRDNPKTTDRGLGWIAGVGAEAVVALPQLDVFGSLGGVAGSAGSTSTTLPFTRGELLVGARYHFP